LIDQIKSKSFENDVLKAQLQGKGFANAALKNELRKLKGKKVVDNTISKHKATTIAPGMFKIETEPLAPKLFKNKDAHIDYIQHSREHADILWEIVKDARALSPLDCNLDSACKYAQRIQEVLVYVHGSCPCLTTPKERLIAVTPMNKDSKVRPDDPVTSLKHSANASESKPSGNTKKYKISQPPSSNKTNKVKDQPKGVKTRKNKKDRVYQIKSHADVMQSVLNTNSKSLCNMCNECLFDVNHDKCVIDCVHDMNVMSKSKYKRLKRKQIWKPTGKVFIEIGLKWKPTGRTFTIVRNECPLTRFTPTKVVPPKENNDVSRVTKIPGIKVVQIIIWYLDSGCSKHMTGNCSQLTNFVDKFFGTLKFGHNLFSVGQLCDSDLEVAFRKHTCFVRNLGAVDLISGSRETNLYTLTVSDMMKSSPICLLSKASKTKSWLWH
nr:hypothetical protein [Tanacetum cinerariifolium]